MKKAFIMSLAVVFAAAGLSWAADCSMWEGTWLVQMDDGSSVTWTVDSVTNQQVNIAIGCQALGTNSEGAEIEIDWNNFAGAYTYTEDLSGSSSVPYTVLTLSDDQQSFTVEAGDNDDYAIDSGTKCAETETDCSDGIDNDCDGDVDGADSDCESESECTDADGDGYYAEDGCGTAVDCDDSNADVNPGAQEVCDDGIDNNCDGSIDEGCETDNETQCTDADGDGYYAEDGCGTAVDCDDSNADVNPGAQEVCGDGIDNNCDGSIDEGCAADNETCPAAAVLGENDERLDALRDFRDTTLAESPAGRLLIRTYYRLGPSVCELLESSPALRTRSKALLEALIPIIKKGL